MASDTTETDDRDNQARDEDEDDDEQSELAHLQADAGMPLDQLLKLYRKNTPTIQNDLSGDSFSSSEVDDEDEEENDDDERRHHLFHVNGDLLPDNDDDTEDSLYEPEIVKFINVGEEYQAYVASKAEYNSVNEHYAGREVSIDELLWSSSAVNETDDENIDEYLKTIHTEYPPSDDEISLQILLNCQLNTQLALVQFRQLPKKTIYSYPAWSLAEIQRFEEGLREYGKDFFQISISKCPNRSVREVVHFYYQWKKSERYRLFIEEQRRIDSLPSVSDIIEKFIEEREQELCTTSGVVDGTRTSSFKFHAPLSSNASISFVTIHQQETMTKRSFDQVDHDEETFSSSTKKTSIHTKTSPAEPTATFIYE